MKTIKCILAIFVNPIFGNCKLNEFGNPKGEGIRSLRKLLFVVLAISFLLNALAGTALGQNKQTFNVVITIDNSYAIYYGPPTHAEELIANAANIYAEDVRNPETFTLTVPDITYIYIAAWSDYGTRQGVLADFANMTLGVKVLSGDPIWQVAATGITLHYLDDEPPTVEELTAQIDLANKCQNPSGGWVNITASAKTNAEGGGYGSAFIVPGVDDNARWMWYDSGRDDSSPDVPFFPGFNHDEYLIFRIPVSLPELAKWSQPPERMDVYVGWDEQSHNLMPRMVADDFLCDSNKPVTAIRWWGSFLGWEEDAVPEPNELPYAFYITIWDDEPDPDPDNPDTFSHPGEVIWDNYCDNYNVYFYGWEYDPRIGKIDLSKFVFYQELDPNDYWYQPNDNQIYWLGIMALYCDCNGDFDGDGDVDYVDIDMFIDCWGQPAVGGCAAADLNCDGFIDDEDLNILCCQVDAGWPDPNCCEGPNNLWGWETREHVFQDDAVRITDVIDGLWPPVIGSVWENGEPIEYPEWTSWDLSFELLTEQNEPGPEWECAKADLYEDGVIDFKDYAIFSSCWLETWP